MPEYATGGLVRAADSREQPAFRLEPDECVLNRQFDCVRSDHWHRFEEGEQRREALAAGLLLIRAFAEES